MDEHYHYTWCLEELNPEQGNINGYKNISSSQTKKN